MVNQWVAAARVTAVVVGFGIKDWLPGRRADESDQRGPWGTIRLRTHGRCLHDAWCCIHLHDGSRAWAALALRVATALAIVSRTVVLC
jgi:hypothetical protein